MEHPCAHPGSDAELQGLRDAMDERHRDEF